MTALLPEVFQDADRELRVVTVDGEPWFVLADLCTALGIKQATRVAERLDDSEKGVDLIHTPGGDQQMLVVNESGMWATVLRSDKPAARALRLWITGTVLPAIRKHGAYLAVPDVQPRTSAEMLLASVQALVEQERAIAALDGRVAELEQAQHVSDSGFRTVMAWARGSGLSVGRVEANSIGRAAGKRCRELGILISKVPDERYGSVNAYPAEIIDDVWTERQTGGAA